ncbi:MAG: AraC family transcriptional regulator [Pseudomonadales bacterium]|nr:AraC family transcriptional regulator [Pseudomonadales bacterium]
MSQKTTNTGQHSPLKQEVKHTVSSHFARVQLDNARRLGIDEEPLLTASRLSPNLLRQSGARIAPQQLAKLYQAIWRANDDEYLGLTEQPSRVGVFSLACEYMLDAKTLGEALKRAMHFYHKVSDSVRFDLIVEQSQLKFSIQLKQPELDPNHLLIELLLLIWHRYPSWLVGEVIPLEAIHFTYGQPDHSAEYRLLYPGPCHYNQSSNTLVWPSAVLDWPIRRTKSQLKAYLREIPLPWFRKQRYLENTTDQVIRFLEDSQQESLIGIEEVAKHFNLTSRTLRRRLTAEGSSFQSLKDQVYRDRAIFWLSQENITIAEVSQRSGYTEPGAFIRAFKHWTGISPGDYRKRLVKAR